MKKTFILACLLALALFASAGPGNIQIRPTPIMFQNGSGGGGGGAGHYMIFEFGQPMQFEWSGNTATTATNFMNYEFP